MRTHAPAAKPHGNVKVKRFPAPAPLNSHRPAANVHEPDEQPNAAVELLRGSVAVNVYLDFVRFRLNEFLVSRRESNS